MDGKKMLDTFDVARQVGMTPRTVQRWAGQGRISGVRHYGREYRFDAASVSAQMALDTFPRPCTSHV